MVSPSFQILHRVLGHNFNFINDRRKGSEIGIDGLQVVERVFKFRRKMRRHSEGCTRWPTKVFTGPQYFDKLFLGQEQAGFLVRRQIARKYAARQAKVGTEVHSTSQRPRACAETPRARTGRSYVRPTQVTGQTASGSLRTYADDARTWKVGWPHSTCEVPEQRCQQSATTQVVRSATRRGDRGPVEGNRRASRTHQDTVPDDTGDTGSRTDTAEGTSGFSCCSLLHVTTRGRSPVR